MIPGKQIKEIEKITNDIKSVQKSINLSTTSLQRADAVTEELIYTAANSQSNDDAMVDAYRNLRLLRSNFDDLISTTSKIGSFEKQFRQYETKIDQETTRLSSQNISRILSDLGEVAKNNASLVEDIKRVSVHQK